MMRILAACAAVVVLAFGSVHADLVDNGSLARNGQDLSWCDGEGNLGGSIDLAQTWLDTAPLTDVAPESHWLEMGAGAKRGPEAEDGWYSEHHGSGSPDSSNAKDAWWTWDSAGDDRYQWTWDRDWWSPWPEGSYEYGHHGAGYWGWWGHTRPRGVSTPLPPAIFLLGPGVAALAAMRRKRKS